jgi:hypothetical protein
MICKCGAKVKARGGHARYPGRPKFSDVEACGTDGYGTRQAVRYQAPGAIDARPHETSDRFSAGLQSLLRSNSIRRSKKLDRR